MYKYTLFDWKTDIELSEITTHREIVCGSKISHGDEIFLVIDVCVNMGKNCVWIIKQMP